MRAAKLTTSSNFNPHTIRRERHHLITLRTKVPQEDGSGFLRVVSETEYSAQITFQFVPITGGINTEVRLVRVEKKL